MSRLLLTSLHIASSLVIARYIRRQNVKAKTLDQYLAEQIRDRREKKNWRQHDLAESARSLGFSWKSDTVAAIEGQARTLTKAEFWDLLQILKVESWTDVFSRNETILIAPDNAVEAISYGRYLAGKDKRPTRAFNVQKVERRLAALAEAEVKAARRLGVDPDEIHTASLECFSNLSLTRKRELLFDEATKGKAISAREGQAIRGHITRQLISRLRKHLFPDTAVKPKTTRRTK
jgi:hypothetical protein